MPPYEPDKWNKFPIQDGTNCYDYAADNSGDLKRGGSQPGRARGHNLKAPVSCRSVNDGAVADGFKPSTKAGICDFTCWKVALVVDRRGKDYHWYRQDPTGNWSHKRGQGPVHAHDADGHAITDPERAARNYGKYNYSIFCGYYCVCPGSFVIASARPEGGSGSVKPEEQTLAAHQLPADIVVRLKKAAILANDGMELHLPPGLVHLSYKTAPASSHEDAQLSKETSSEATSVQAMIRSGLPDPSWSLDAADRDELGKLALEVMTGQEITPFVADLPGFLVRNLSDTLPFLYVGYEGIIVAGEDGHQSYRAASLPVLDWLLQSAASNPEADEILGSFEPR